MAKSFIWDIPEDEFIETVNHGKTYLGIARELGHFGSNGGTIVKNRIEHLGIDFKPRHHKEISSKDFYTKGSDRGSHLRTRVVKDNFMEYVCSCCGTNPEWQGKPLVLEIDHVNGDATDNTKENLRYLCPNCHSQTDTYKGRNKKSNRDDRDYELTCEYCSSSFKSINRHKKYCSSECLHKATIKQPPVSKDELLSLLYANSFTAVGKMYNVSDNAVRKWCLKYGISSKSKDYR